MDFKFLPSLHSSEVSLTQAVKDVIISKCKNEGKNKLNYILKEDIGGDQSNINTNNDENISIEEDNENNNNNNDNNKNTNNNDNRNNDNNDKEKNEIKASEKSSLNKQNSEENLSFQNNSFENISQLLIKSENPLLSLYEVSQCHIFIVFTFFIEFLNISRNSFIFLMLISLNILLNLVSSCFINMIKMDEILIILI